MTRILIYELKKIFSLPVCVLWAAAVVILVAMSAGRYGNFTSMHGLPAAEVRSISMEYAGPLDQALADQALADWRALPNDWHNPDPPETQARRSVLRTLDEEFQAAAGLEESQPPNGASADAAARLAPMLRADYAPFVHGYWEGWRALLAAFGSEAAWLCAVMAAFGASALFSGEGATTMAACVRTARHGRGTLALGKLVAAAAYGLISAAACFGLPMIVCAALFGVQGGGLPAQYAAGYDSQIAYPLTLAQLAGLQAAMGALGALALALCTGVLSAAMASVTTPAVAAMALFAAPTIAAMLKLASPALDCVLRYAPSRLLLPLPLLENLNPAQLWQGALWQPAWLCALWAAALPLLGWAAARLWLRVARQEPISQD